MTIPLLFSPPAWTQIEVTPSGMLNHTAQVRPAKPESAVYVVQMREPPAATYRGTQGARLRPAAERRLDTASAPVRSYAQSLELSHDRVLAEIGAGSSKLYSYRYALNGFAANLSPQQASRLAQHPEVERVWADGRHEIRTNNSAIYLGLQDQNGGLRADLGLRGEDVIIGVIDSGIAPEHPALRDSEPRIPRSCTTQWARSSWLGRWLCRGVRRNPPQVKIYDPPRDFRGVCEAGERFSPSDCNNKLVAARFYVDGFLFRQELDPGEFLSPRDADGHGTHIATTAAGNTVTASIFGTRVGQISGIAPRARIAAYKACWVEPGATRASCATSDLTRAIDDAVADGVHIINYSVGNLDPEIASPNDLALLNALEAGVLSIVAAGNDGPELGTIGSPSSAPWVVTVAAGTQSGTRYEEGIQILAPEDMSGTLASREAGFTPPLRDRPPLEAQVALADDGQSTPFNGLTGSRYDACEPLINAAELSGRIALIERGGCTYQFKLGQVEAAGAIGAIIYNNVGGPIVMNGEPGSVAIPAVMISAADGQQLVNRLVAGSPVRARLAAGVLMELEETGNRLGVFSSRGPAQGESDFVKPDVTAPGINILAGHTPDVANGLSGELFQYQTGTSMSTPEVAGIAALLMEARPDWTPAMFKSALTTTAQSNVLLEDGTTPAHTFEMGAGHVRANRAVDPGLVYDAGFVDFAAYLCGIVQPPFPADQCASHTAGRHTAARQVNQPAIGITQLITGDQVVRRVTNVGPSASYSATVDLPAGFSATVQPSSLSLASGQSAEYTVTFQTQGADLDLWSFGSLSWSDGTHDVISPLALRPSTLRAVPELWLSGQSGAHTLPVDFGYSGAYFAGVHGLRAPLVLEGFVDEDTTRSFSFRFDQGVSAHFIEIPPDQLVTRFALFDEYTGGNDDLDLYLFRCPDTQCVQVAQSGAYTSTEEINLILPEPGTYAVLIHGFQTDSSGGTGTTYSLFSWSVGLTDLVGNFSVSGPDTVVAGDSSDLDLNWNALASGTRYLGVVSHGIDSGINALTWVNVDTGLFSAAP